MNPNHSIQYLAGRYLVQLFAKSLPTNLIFHNFHHTINVVRGVRKIGKNLKLSSEELEILELAAWFHDSGHVEKYKGHEVVSQQLAAIFLNQQRYPAEKIRQILSCIAATKMPQQPQNLMEKVICDADLYHLSLDEYIHLQFLLREEWHQVFGIEKTDLEWHQDNLAFLENHQYFTEYGKTALQKRKEVNVEKCRFLVEAYAEMAF